MKKVNTLTFEGVGGYNSFPDLEAREELKNFTVGVNTAIETARAAIENANKVQETANTAGGIADSVRNELAYKVLPDIETLKDRADTNAANIAVLAEQKASKTDVQNLTESVSAAEIDIDNLEKRFANSGIVSPEDFGAKGDGIADDSDAFIAALRSGKKVVCDGSKTYNFVNPIDVCDLITGYLDGNFARFNNFHIYINLGYKKNENDTPDVRQWRDNFPSAGFVIENMRFYHDTYSWYADNTAAGWQAYLKDKRWTKPLITTGAPMVIRNIILKGYPYVLATTCNYIDKMVCEGWDFSTNGDLYTPDDIDLDAVSVIDVGNDGKTSDVNEITYARKSKDVVERWQADPNKEYSTMCLAGDGWRFVSCHEFRMANVPEWCLMRPFNNQPVLFESCIQSRVHILDGGRVIANGCHWEQTDITADSSANYMTASFINCYFYPNHELIDRNTVTYLNCIFETYHCGSHKRTIANITGDKSWYDLKCVLINCALGLGRCVDTNYFRECKNAPKRTYRPMEDGVEFERSMTVQDGDYGGAFPSTGNYNYSVYLLATSQPNIALKEQAYTATINDLGQQAWFSVGNAKGGYGIVAVRKNPDNSVLTTEYHIDPNYDVSNVNVLDQGAFCRFEVFVGKTRVADVFTPWVPVLSAPTFTIKDNLYEANGALVTTDDSDCGVQNGQVQVFTTLHSQIEGKVNRADVYAVGGRARTVNLNDEVYELGYISSNGANKVGDDANGYRTKNFIPVEGGRTILYTIGNMGSKITDSWMAQGLLVWQYDANKQIVGSRLRLIPTYRNGEITNADGNDFDVKTITLDNDTAYIRFDFQHWKNTAVIDEVLIEAAITYLEDAVTSYIPYYTYPLIPYIASDKVALKSPDGTLYTLTVADDGTIGTKELVVSS